MDWVHYHAIHYGNWCNPPKKLLNPDICTTKMGASQERREVSSFHWNITFACTAVYYILGRGRVENRFCIAHIRVGRYSRGGGGWGGGCRSRPDLNIFPLPGTSQSMYILLGRFSHISIFRNHKNWFLKSFQYLVYVVVLPHLYMDKKTWCIGTKIFKAHLAWQTNVIWCIDLSWPLRLLLFSNVYHTDCKKVQWEPKINSL